MRNRIDLSDLIDIAPPPDSPVDAGSAAQWDRIECDLGTVLPADYKLVTNVYGTGIFNDLFFLFNPFSLSDKTNLLWQAGVPDSFTKDEELGRVYAIGSNAAHFDEMRVSYPELALPALYPEPGGLLPLGGDTNGGCAFWQTGEAPDEWPLILYPTNSSPRNGTP